MVQVAYLTTWLYMYTCTVVYLLKRVRARARLRVVCALCICVCVCMLICATVPIRNVHYFILPLYHSNDGRYLLVLTTNEPCRQREQSLNILDTSLY